MKYFILLFSFLLLSHASFAEEYRSWVSADGSKTIEAALVSYDNEKEIVTIKLKNGKTNRVKLSMFSKSDQEFVKDPKEKEDNPFADEAFILNEVVRITLSLDEYGEGIVSVEKTDKPYKSTSIGSPARIPPLSKTNVQENKDGTFTLYHDFSEADDIKLWCQENELPHAVRIESNMLKMLPINFTFQNKKKAKVAFLTHRAFFRLPMCVCFDVVSFDSGSIRLAIEKIPLKENDYGRLTLDLKLKDNDMCSMGLFWIAGEKQEDLIKMSDVSFDSTFENKFQLPGPSIKYENRFTCYLSYGYVNHEIKPLELSNLRLTAKLVPLIGASFNEKDSIIFVNNVIPNRPADKSGFKKGDIIKSINGKIPQTTYEATSLISDSSFNKEITIIVERRDKEEAIKVIPEL